MVPVMTDGEGRMVVMVTIGIGVCHTLATLSGWEPWVRHG